MDEEASRCGPVGSPSQRWIHNHHCRILYWRLIGQYTHRYRGASKWFNQSWVTYSYDAKIRELNVDPKTLEKRGAVLQKLRSRWHKEHSLEPMQTLPFRSLELLDRTTMAPRRKWDSSSRYCIENMGNCRSTQIGGNRQENKEVCAFRPSYGHTSLGPSHGTCRTNAQGRNKTTQSKQTKALEEIERNKEQQQLHNLQSGNPSLVGRYCVDSDSNLGTDVEWSSDSANE